jgi:hypothetical protein
MQKMYLERERVMIPPIVQEPAFRVSSIKRIKEIMMRRIMTLALPLIPKLKGNQKKRGLLNLVFTFWVLFSYGVNV